MTVFSLVTIIEIFAHRFVEPLGATSQVVVRAHGSLACHSSLHLAHSPTALFGISLALTGSVVISELLPSLGKHAL